jgi:hypothetical protein
MFKGVYHHDEIEALLQICEWACVQGEYSGNGFQLRSIASIKLSSDDLPIGKDPLERIYK